MHWKHHTRTGARVVALAVSLGISASAVAQSAAPARQITLKELFENAWSQQPEAKALPARRDAAQAHRRAAQAWTPEAPAIEASYKTDRINGNGGARELEYGLAAPLWLPGERGAAGALSEAEVAAVESRAAAARLRLAATVRDAWWGWQRASVDVDTARAQLDAARRLATDVARRAKAGELARADQNLADGAVAAAEAAVAQAEAVATAARQHVATLLGGAAGSLTTPSASAEPEPRQRTSDAALSHPALDELRDKLSVASRSADLAARQSRSNPEIALTTTRDRGVFGEPYGQTVTLAVRIPLGAGPRQDARVAAARADAIETQAQLQLERARLEAEREAAQARVRAAQAQLAAAERRATLARENRGFYEKSFRLGESDLPTRLRIETEASDAERQAARGRIELAAAVSAWRQVLGLLPE